MQWNEESRYERELENAFDLIQALVSPEAFKSLRVAFAEEENPGYLSSPSTTYEEDTASHTKPKAPKVQGKKEGEEVKDGRGLGHKLTPQLVVQLFQLRPKPSPDGSLRRGSMLHCKVLASKFGVTPKTVRDIWNGRTWFSATKPYWSKAERQRKAYFASDAYDDVAAADLAAPIIAEQMQPQSDCSMRQHPTSQHMMMGGQAHQNHKAADSSAMNGGLPYMNMMNVQTQQNAMIYKNSMDNIKTLHMAMGNPANPAPPVGGLSMPDMNSFSRGANGGFGGGMHTGMFGGANSMGSLPGMAHGGLSDGIR